MMTFVWSIIFGILGMGYVSYGKSQRSINAMLCGVGLMAFPWFVSGLVLTLLVGTVLLIIPWIWRD